MATRRYEQRARAEEAEKTRQRIIDAVVERLRAAPSEPVSVERIAEMAGVARSTVYAIFGSRARAVRRRRPRTSRERPGYARLVEASHRPDAREALRGGLRAASAMLAARSRHLARAALDGAARSGGGRRRRRSAGSRSARRRWRRIARAACTSRATCAPGVSVEEANDVLWVITSFESFDLLYTGRGLPLDAVVERLTATAERALMTP